MDGEIVAMDATAMAGTIAAHKLSCHQVMEANLGRIEAVNPTYNAIVSLRPARALLAEADEAEAAVARNDPLGPLHGFPVQ